MIYTHFNLDLDAAASLWAYGKFSGNPVYLDEVKFVPANFDGSEMTEGDVALDIDAGGKGIKGEKGQDGAIHSCFATLISKYCDEKQQLALKELVSFVDAQDRGNAAKNLGVQGEAARVWSFTGLNAVLRAFQGQYPRNDRMVAMKMFEIFDGLYHSGQRRAEAEKEADTAKIIGDVAIMENAKCFGTNGVLFERGVKSVVFVDGNNLGAVRGDGVDIRMDHPAIKAAVGDEQGWFFHPAGFLAARGTRKSPAESKSAVQPEALAAAIQKALDEQKGGNS